MLVAVGSDKGAPGATTLSMVLALCWPGQRVVCELDLRGADLPYRLRAADGEFLRPAPSIVGLAVDSRPGTAAPDLPAYAQQTQLGVPVIRGEVTTRASSKVSPHLPAVARVAAAWRGVVLADLGSLQPSNPALVVAKAAAIVLLVAHATAEGLGHLRARVEELAAYVGDPSRDRTPVSVVVVAETRAAGRAVEHVQAVLTSSQHRLHVLDRAAGRAVEHVQAVLTSIGSPVPVVGAFAYDPAAAALLWQGQVTKKLARSALIRSGEQLVGQLCRLWPEQSTTAVERPSVATASGERVGGVP
jgi:hypothetical protein